MRRNEISRWYETVNKLNSHFTTDLNNASIGKIVKEVSGSTVLDIACGSGYLSKILGEKGFDVTAADFVKPRNACNFENVTYVKANVENLPFDTRKFDTVISAHTLEHTVDIRRAITELRRVARKKLIVILPRERPYRAGCNFHTHFFAYDYAIYQTFGYMPSKQSLCMVGGDWFYTEMIGKDFRGQLENGKNVG